MFSTEGTSHTFSMVGRGKVIIVRVSRDVLCISCDVLGIVRVSRDVLCIVRVCRDVLDIVCVRRDVLGIVHVSCAVVSIMLAVMC